MLDGAIPSAGEEHWPAILDVNEVSLEALVDHDDSVLSDALRHLVGCLARPAETYAAHSSSA